MGEVPGPAKVGRPSRETSVMTDVSRMERSDFRQIADLVRRGLLLHELRVEMEAPLMVA